MRRHPIALLCLLLALAGLNAGDGLPKYKELVARATEIRPTKEEMLWQQIPWLDSLVEAREQAQLEKRPVLVWTLDEDPFERC